MTYYELLGVQQNASEEDIKSAFRKLAVQKHPDKGGSAQEFIQLKTAYDTLKNPLLRKDYDLKLKPESIDNTYNTQHDFQQQQPPRPDQPPEPTQKTRPEREIDEDDVIRQLAKVAWQIRFWSVLNTVGGLLLGLAGVVLTIITLGYIVFSGLMNSGFGMMSRNIWQIVNPYPNLFGVLSRSYIPPTDKITSWIRLRRRGAIIRFWVIITLLAAATLIYLLYTL